MEISLVLKELIKKHEMILDAYNCDVEEAEKDPSYSIIKEAIEQLVNAINKVNNQEILINSYLFVNENIEECNLEELIDWDKVNNALKIEIV